MKEKYILVRGTSHEDGEDPNYLICIRLEASSEQKLWNRRRLFAQLKHADSYLSEMRFADPHSSWWTLGTWNEVAFNDHVVAKAENALFADNGYCVAKKEPPEPELARVAAEELIVEEDGFRLTAYEKYSGAVMTSELVPWTWLLDKTPQLDEEELPPPGPTP